jgi:hypothetical protein
MPLYLPHAGLFTGSSGPGPQREPESK